MQLEVLHLRSCTEVQYEQAHKLTGMYILYHSAAVELPAQAWKLKLPGHQWVLPWPDRLLNYACLVSIAFQGRPGLDLWSTGHGLVLDLIFSSGPDVRTCNSP